MNIFLIILLICCICLRLRLYAVDLFDNLTYGRVDGLVVKDFLGRVHEEDIHSILAGEHMLLLSECLSDTSFAEIALDSSLEELLGYGYHNAVYSAVRSVKALVAYARHTAVLTFGKKLRYGRLAAQSFFLRKSITDLPFHG